MQPQIVRAKINLWWPSWVVMWELDIKEKQSVMVGSTSSSNNGGTKEVEACVVHTNIYVFREVLGQNSPLLHYMFVYFTIAIDETSSFVFLLLRVVVMV